MLEILATIAALRGVEETSFQHYFDTVIPDRQLRSSWAEAYERDLVRSRGLGQLPPLHYDSRDSYKQKVRNDFEQARTIIREHLTAGILSLGGSAYSEEAVATVLNRLRFRVPDRLAPDDVATVAALLPILSDTTRDIGTASSVVQVRDSDDQTVVIPAVMLTSSFNITLMQISRLLVRRTFVQSDAVLVLPGREAVLTTVNHTLYLRPERQMLAELQGDARALSHFLGIWLLGEPFPTPPAEDSVIDAAQNDLASADQLINTTAADHKSGWCLFEALHEFSHILMGDWLLPSDEWSPEAELRADNFAAFCLMMSENDLARVLYLRGACSFLRLLGFLEKSYGRTPRHPDAWMRADSLEEFGFRNPFFDTHDTRLFHLTSELDLLARWCFEPNRFGFHIDNVYGS